MAKTPVRLWIAAGLAACLLVALGGWTFVVGPQRARVAEDTTSLQTSQLANATLASRSKLLETQFAGIADRQSELLVKQQLLPPTNDLDTLIVALNAAAATSGVVVEELSAGAPQDITPAPAVPVAAETAAPSDETAPAAVVEATPSGPALYELPVTLRVSGTLASIEAFLALAQNGARAILFVSLGIVPAAETTALGPGAMLTAETTVYARPDSSAGDVAAGP